LCEEDRKENFDPSERERNSAEFKFRMRYLFIGRKEGVMRKSEGGTPRCLGQNSFQILAEYNSPLTDRSE
jgi:hypothetical protein